MTITLVVLIAVFVMTIVVVSIVVEARYDLSLLVFRIQYSL